MDSALTSRRHLLLTGLLSCAGLCLPAGALAADPPPAWLTPLTRKLADFTAWMKTEHTARGETVIHCGTGSYQAWAKHAGCLAGVNGKVHARGNTLSFLYDGHPVRIVIHPEVA